jgi:putative hydrolase of the HAD superfamily
MRPYPRALLLDMDDTILAFDHGAADCWRHVCARYAKDAGCEPETLYQAIDEAREWFWSDPDRHREGRLRIFEARRKVVRIAFERLGLSSALVDATSEAYVARRDEILQPFPGAVETLTEFRARGMRLGMITNGEAEGQRAKIVRFQLAPLFDYILVEGEFGTGKPEERVFRHVLSELETEPHDAWMVGDNLDFDIAPAQRLGIHAIWVDHRNTGLPANTLVRPDRTVVSICELL